MPPVQQRKRYLSDVPLQPWSHLRIWLFCGGILMLLYGLARDPGWVETSYVDGFGGTAAAWLAWITAPIPFSVAEILLVLLAGWLIWATLSGAAEVGAGRRSWTNAMLGGLFTVLDVGLFVAAWFYLSWGVAYARPPAAVRFELPVERLATMGQDERLVLEREAALRAIERTNQAYRELHGSLDAGEVTQPGKAVDVDAALERAFERLARDRELPEAFATPRGPVKTPLLSPVLSRLGVAGVYAPFTGETNVNGGPPRWSQVMTAAHEKAHQRMVASEDEATFVGLLALVHSDDPLLRYAGWQEARRLLQRSIVEEDPQGMRALEGKLAAGPQRDIIALGQYWENYQGPMEKFGDAMNDSYLRMNHVEGGIGSYARAGLLVAAWAQTPDGRSLLSSEGGRASR
jgi:hypothetical protein